MKHIARELFLYGAASAIAFAADVTLLVALVEVAGIPYLVAASIAFIVGGVLAWALCVRWVFKFRRVADRRFEALAFVTLGLAGLVIHLAGMAAAVEWLGLHYLLAKIGAATLSFGANYALRRLALFTPQRPAAG